MLAQILWILFAVLLLIFCAILLVFEIFIPSLGLLTATALLCLAGGIYIFFQMSATAGWIGVWTAIILIPIVWVLVYKLLPKTKLGRILELHSTLKAVSGVPDQEKLDALEGQTGTVLSPLRPVGMCAFNGKKVVCVSEAGFIEKQTQVKVIHVEGNKVTVRKNETD
ncbi:MAG: NfeD family protein [Planctomycetota bacterium]|jgi:membrane-bound serine protease (ClpP class)